MPQNKELEIRRQFLEEAQEYLNTIESVILGAATTRIDNQKLDAILRAAHSIKGGAAMMGFQTLSHLAHRLEDFFKVLKVQQHLIESELESLLLGAVDCLSQTIALHRQGVGEQGCTNVLDQEWLNHANSVFEQLHQLIGEPACFDEDAAAPQLSEDGQDMVATIFETEVEGCLQRLESVLAAPEKPCLFEELSIMAQELGGLGEMLQLNAFTNLCESITQHLEATPDRVEEIARLALQAWRRSKAALLIGQVDTLPTQIDVDLESVSPLPITENQSDVQTVDFKTLQFSASSELNVPPEVAPATALSQLKPSTDAKENQENTVRVPSKQLDQLNDLFGDLTIERNGLDVHLERLRNLVRILSHWARTLQRFDTRRRTASEESRGQGTGGRGERVNGFPSNGSQSPEFSHTVAPSTPSASPALFLQQLPLELMETIVRIQEVTDDIDLSLEDTEQTVGDLNRTAKQLQTNITQVRMRPLSDLVDRFPRAIRELSLQYGKKVELNIHGSGTLIDRAILEALSDPLMQLLRNAFDHGIEDAAIRQASGKPEQGAINISAVTRGNQTLISVSDDGSGIDLDKIRQQADRLGLDLAAIAAASDEELLTLIFEPGFSTAGEVTTLSGRGVGLDVVRTNLRQLRGDIKVNTQLGVGTTFTLSVPLTLSVTRVLLVESNRMLLAFPTDAIEEMLLLNPEQILKIAGKEVLSWEGTMVPLIYLGHWLEFSYPQMAVDSENLPLMSVPTVLMIAQGNELVGLQVDRCWGEQEVAIRKVEGNIAMPPGFTSCTILGDGRVVPLVNPPELLHWIASCKQSYSSKPEEKSPKTTVLQSQKDTILVVDDSINVRRFLSLTLEKAGYRVEQAKDGQDAFEKLTNGLPVRAIICDIDMPRLDGYGLLARVKSAPALKHLPMAMLTSRSGDKHRQLAMDLGATVYFSKPYNEQELLKTLKQLL